MIVRLRYLTLVTLLSLCVTSVVAQKIDGYFVSRASGASTTFFLLPQELFEAKSGSRIKHDVTIKRDGVADSTRINFTYHSDVAMPIDSIAIASKSLSLSGGVERIYIEPDTKSKGWNHRYGFLTTMKDLTPFYNVDAPATMTLYSNGEATVYECRVGEWSKYAPIGAKIFAMIRLN